ncbi:hypothetical protein NE611_17555, partial [Anaerostipes caccae]|uniref:hypothetical protein n=1 Tax=Anaerostipes caccae TaxID=105841 RepID=UPI00210BBFF4
CKSWIIIFVAVFTVLISDSTERDAMDYRQLWNWIYRYKNRYKKGLYDLLRSVCVWDFIKSISKFLMKVQLPETYTHGRSQQKESRRDQDAAAC